MYLINQPVNALLSRLVCSGVRVLPLSTILGITALATADTFTVDDNAPADFSTIQDAVDAATDGDTIIVKPGLYEGPIVTGAPPPVVDMTSKELTIRGSGTASETIISGTSDRPCLVCGDASNIVIERIAFLNGVAAKGGGVNIDAGFAVFRDCVFEDNTASATGSGQGGGLWMRGGIVTLERCHFNRNESEGAGGGIYRAHSEGFSMLELIDCGLTYNLSNLFYGGGLYNSGRMTATRCEFENNLAGFAGAGGGAWHEMDPMESASFIDCNFKHNGSNPAEVGDVGAGGLGVSYGTEVLGCAFIQNATGADGGGLWIGTATVPSELGTPVTDCTFERNVALANGGGIRARSSASLTNCLFSSNGALNGGGMYGDNAVQEVMDSEFTDNIAVKSGGGLHGSAIMDRVEFNYNIAGDSGAGYYVKFVGASLVDCLFVGNETDGFGGGIYHLEGDVDVLGCLFERNKATVMGGGIWSTALSGAVEVLGSTFCANTVDHTAGPVADLGGNSYSATCGEPCPSDLNGDGSVGGADLAALLGAWGNLGGPEDINEDGVVNGADLAILLGAWGSCG